MPRFLLITCASPIAATAEGSLAHRVWRGLLTVGPVATVVVGDRPAQAERRAFRQQGGRSIAARWDPVTGKPELGGRARRARVNARLASWIHAVAPDAVILADPGLAGILDALPIAPARLILLADTGTGNAEMAAALDRGGVDATWAAVEDQRADRSLAARPTVFVDGSADAVAAAWRLLDPDSPATRADPADTLEPALRDVAGFVNPLTRLLSVTGCIRAAVPSRALSGAFTGPSLVNAQVRLTPIEDDWAWFSADAILPDGVACAELSIRFAAYGLDLLTLPVDPAPPHERAGLLAIEPLDDDTVSIDAWSLDPAPRVLAGDRPLSAVFVRPPGPVAAARLQAEAPWPAPGTAIKAAPAQGWGQNCDHPGGWLAPATPSSTRLLDLRDRHRGEAAWLIGNGPSVRPEDLDRLADCVTFAFNRFHLARDTTRLCPRYTISADRQMIEDFGQEIVDRSAGLVMLARATPPDIVGDQLWLRLVEVQPPLFSFEPARTVSAGGSSLFVALQLAFFMGVRRVFLYGADFQFAFEQKGGVDAYRSATGEGNHFIPDYRGGRPWCPPDLRSIATGFLAARVVFESVGGSIVNATRGGALEMFPRLDFEAALESAEAGVGGA